MTFTPTYETLVLTKRVEDGDPLAIKDLWEHLFPDAEFDPTRPIKDISDDISTVLDEYVKEQSDKSGKENQDLTSNFDRLLSEAEEIVALILDRHSKSKVIAEDSW